MPTYQGFLIEAPAQTKRIPRKCVVLSGATLGDKVSKKDGQLIEAPAYTKRVPRRCVLLSGAILGDKKSADGSAKQGMIIEAPAYSKRLPRRCIVLSGALMSDKPDEYIKITQKPGFKVRPFVLDDSGGVVHVLVATPTHVYRAQDCTLNIDRSSIDNVSYTVLVNGVQAIKGDSIAKNFNIVLANSALTYGTNAVKVDLLYKDGTTDSVSAVIVKEKPQRVQVERTFHSYDGGYVMNGTMAINDSVVTNTTGSMTTTSYTSVNLNRYAGINRVVLNGVGPSALFSFDGRVTWQSYSAGKWTTVAPTMANAVPQGVVNSMGAADWAKAFTATQLDIMVFLGSAAYSLKTINIELPENTGPRISASLTSKTITRTPVVLSATITDVDGDNISYNVQINGVDVIPWTSLAVGPASVTLPITPAMLKLGSNVVQIFAKDDTDYEKGPYTVSSLPLYVDYINNNPCATVILTKKGLQAALDDVDHDMADARVYLNSHVIREYGGYRPTPFVITETFPRAYIEYGKINTVWIEVKDSFGGENYWEGEFIGDYDNLIFLDANGAILSDDSGATIKIADLGLQESGATTKGHLLKVHNSTLDVATGFTISQKAKLTTDMKFSATPQGPYYSTLPLPSMNPGDTYNFYVEVTTDPAATLPESVHIEVK